MCYGVDGTDEWCAWSNLDYVIIVNDSNESLQKVNSIMIVD